MSVFQAVSLFDRVTVLPATAGTRTVRVTGEGSDLVPTDGTNLAVRSAAALATYADVELGVRLEIVKSIPVAGGMAGGSADAAAALVGCNALWRLGLERATLAEIGAALGSDVPFALHGGTALATGRGEQIAEAHSEGDYHWVFALADRGLSTPAVYAELDRQRGIGRTGDGQAQERPNAVLAALGEGDPRALGQTLHNDLEEPALHLRPELGRTLAAGRKLGALGWLLCGSGPTCAFLAGDVGHSATLAAALAEADVCRAVHRAHGPVPGAQLLAG